MNLNKETKFVFGKKIIALITLGMISLSAGSASVELFDNTKTQIGGEVGKNIVIMYPNNAMGKITSLEKLTKAKISLKNQVCDGDTKALIDTGYRVIFIYPGENKTRIFTIDSCS